MGVLTDPVPVLINLDVGSNFIHFLDNVEDLLSCWLGFSSCGIYQFSCYYVGSVLEKDNFSGNY